MKRGEIYVVDLGPGVGREVSGVCPVVVVSNDVNNLTPAFVAVLPAVGATDIRAPLGRIVTSAESGYPTDVAIMTMCPAPSTPVGSRLGRSASCHPGRCS